MNLLSSTVVVFCPRHLSPASIPRVERRDVRVKSAALFCRWERNRATGQIDCVWTPPDAGNAADATDYLRLAS